MTNLLVRLFVKDYDKTLQAPVRTGYGMLAAVTGIICNLILFLTKLSVGVLVHSVSVMADAFNNLSDAASSVIGFIGVKMAQKPADKDHPFGHGRIEYITAFIVSFLVIEVGFTFLKDSINKIKDPQEITFRLVPVIILILSIGVKLWLAYFNNTLAKRVDSAVMKATAADSLGDVITTAATVLSISIYHFTGKNIDGFVGVLVALMVMWAGISIAKETLEPLIGEAIDPQLYKEVIEYVEGYEGILGTHDLIIHNYGPGSSMASIHAEVSKDVDILITHELIDRIERDINRERGIFLVIHMDPLETENGKIKEITKILGKVLEELDARLTFHDLRMVSGEEQINLIFDLVVPFEYTEQQEQQLAEQVARIMTETDKRYKSVITVEKSFVDLTEQE